MKQLSLFLLLLCVSTASIAGKVYKWTDENGQVHYSTFPPTQADTEKVRVPSSSRSSQKNSGSDRSNKNSRDRRYSKSREERNRLREERAKKRAAKNYNRKYGPEAQLRKLEEEKYQEKARADRIHRERIRKLEQARKQKEFKKKMKGFKDKMLGLEDECEAAHGTDCGNPEYLKKWVKKKYEPKK